MSGSRAAAAGRRAHPAVVARRRRIARDRGRQRRGLALIGVAALAALALLWWLAHGPLLTVGHVRVRGYEGADREALVAAIDTAASHGTMVSPAVGDIRTAAAAFPRVSAVSVQRDWPRGLTVDIVPARPAAAAAAAGSDPVLVSEEGRVLGPVPKDAGMGWVRLPSAPPPAGYALPDSQRAGLEFLAAAAPEAARRVRQLGVDAAGDLSGRVVGGPVLRLGKPDHLGAKARALALVLAKVPAADLADATYIDVRVPKRPSIGGIGPATPPADASATIE